MANVIYPKYKQAAMGGGANHDLLAGDVRCILIDLADYTYAATHEFLSSVAAAARVATSPTLTGKSVTDGVFDADNTSFTAVSGDVSEALLFYVHTGSDASARLVALVDTGVTGLPVTPNGGNINVGFNASGIFKI